MEKKKYMTPEILVRRITPHSILEGTTVDPATKTNQVLSKEGNGYNWDDIDGNSNDDSDESNSW